MAKPKSSLLSSVASMFSSSANPPVPSSSSTPAKSTQYNKVITGESFEGERELVANVFSTERQSKMHRLAKDHQSALSASDIIELRKMGVTVNKSLVSDYSKYVSLKEQSGKPSEVFTKWLNIKTGPSMTEAPSMFVMQLTEPGKSVNKIEIREFGAAGIHYGQTAAEESNITGKTTVFEATGDASHFSVNKKEMDALKMFLMDKAGLAEYMEKKATAKNERTLIDKLKSMRKKIRVLVNEAHDDKFNQQIEDAQGGIKAYKDVCERIKLNAENLSKELDEIQAELGKDGEQETPEGNANTGNSQAHMSVEMQTALVNKAADALMEKQAELDKHQTQMDTIRKHIKSTGSRARRGADQVADHVHSLCKQLIAEREKNEALMAQSVGGASCGADASSSPLLQKAMDSLSLLNEQKRQLEEKVKGLTHDNEVFAKDASDMQATADHYKATVNTLMGQNMDLKKMASREQFEKETHRSRAADLSQKLASTLHYHFTDENGEGNATVFLKAKEDCCDCNEFDQAAARNEVEGALLVGSTQTMLNKLRVGDRARMEIHNCSGLTNASYNVASAVDVERMTDRSDGTVRGRLLDTLMLGKHTIQSEICVTGEKQDHYALTLNAK